MIEELIERPSHLNGSSTDYSNNDIKWIAQQFQIAGPVVVAPFPGRGNINLHTYEVNADGAEYLLQKVNSDVFTMPDRVMKAMVASIGAQVSSLQSDGADELWTPIELVPVRDGSEYLDLTDEHGWSVWRMMIRIPKTVSYKSLGEVDGHEAQMKLAEEVGRGLAIYSDLTSTIDPKTVDGSLPGYRDTALYYSQFHSVMACNRTLEEAAELIPQDKVLRRSTEKHFLVAIHDEEYELRKSDPELVEFIELVTEREPFTKGLWTALEEGRIRHTLIHGDTKIENFLFCSESGDVKSLVDLDTIMPFTWLADYGDLQRSMVNVAGEKERDLDKVRVNKEVYKSVAKGFLGASKEVTENEVKLMVASVQAITLELGLRFLTDYLRGDTYFGLGESDPRDLNKVRAMVQLTLYKELVKFSAEAEALMDEYRRQ